MRRFMATLLALALVAGLAVMACGCKKPGGEPGTGELKGAPANSPGPQNPMPVTGPKAGR